MTSRACKNLVIMLEQLDKKLDERLEYGSQYLFEHIDTKDQIDETADQIDLMVDVICEKLKAL